MLQPARPEFSWKKDHIITRKKRVCRVFAIEIKMEEFLQYDYYQK